MAPEDWKALRELRDALEDESDKRMVRKALNYISSLERQLATVRTLLRTVQNEAAPQRGDYE